jgi:NAD(P)H-dependent FMN reductase
MRILAILGSLGAGSNNLALLELAAAVAPEGVEVTLFAGLGTLPHFDPDVVESPPPVLALRRAVAASDALLIAAPEYGHSLPGVLKNAIDWLIGTGELERKVIAITASVPGASRVRLGLAALRQTLGAVSATIVGGEPIVRGPGLEASVRALLDALIEAAKTDQRS